MYGYDVLKQKSQSSRRKSENLSSPKIKKLNEIKCKC